ncbi:TPA: hypothetical protein ACH3X1_008685 [Trebouxia sp. C0004]
MAASSSRQLSRKIGTTQQQRSSKQRQHCVQNKWHVQGGHTFPDPASQKQISNTGMVGEHEGRDKVVAAQPKEQQQRPLGSREAKIRGAAHFEDLP